jgi:hypothetical protein
LFSYFRKTCYFKVLYSGLYQSGPCLCCIWQFFDIWKFHHFVNYFNRLSCPSTYCANIRVYQYSPKFFIKNVVDANRLLSNQIYTAIRISQSECLESYRNSVSLDNAQKKYINHLHKAWLPTWVYRLWLKQLKWNSFVVRMAIYINS